MIASFVFAMGVRVPYSRPLNAVLDFLRDVTEPYLRIFRRLPLRDRAAGPDADRGAPRAADRRRHHRGPDRSGPVSPAGRAALVAAATVAADQAVKALVRTTIERGDAVDLILGDRARQRAQPRDRVRAVLRRRRAARAVRARRAGGAARVLRPPPRPPARVAPDRPADRRRHRQPDRPRARAGPSPTSSTCRRGRRSTSPTSRSRSACCRCCTCSRGRRAMDERELVVGPDAAGERLDVFLAPRGGSRAAAQRLIDAGLVLVDGAPVPKRHAVAARRARSRRGRGRGAREPAVPDAPFAVAYEDEHLLVVDKPAGVVVHPARGHARARSCRRSAGRVAGGDDPRRPGIVHRLDRDTSGLLVVARTEAAHAALKAMLRAARGHARVPRARRGPPAGARGTIDAPLGRDRRVRTRISTDTDEPREAITHFEIERRCRTHAAARAARDRPHAPDPRAPAGDRPPGGRRPRVRPRGLLGLERQFLHAERLAFRASSDRRCRARPEMSGPSGRRRGADLRREGNGLSAPTFVN